jgi:hypothetical protein
MVEPKVIKYFIDELYRSDNVTTRKELDSRITLYELMVNNRSTKFEANKIQPSLGFYLHIHKVQIKHILKAIKDTITVDIRRCNEDPDGVDEREMTILLVGMDLLHDIFSEEDKAMKVFLN